MSGILVHPDAKIGEGFMPAPFSVIDEGVTIGDGVRIGSFVHVCAGATIGDGCTIGDHVTVHEGGNALRVTDSMVFTSGDYVRWSGPAPRPWWTGAMSVPGRSCASGVTRRGG